jgi:RNA polymerase sigma factor (sigma-70 family)
MPDEPGRRRFATTRWSLVIATHRKGSDEAATALATLCEDYWGPVYGFIRRMGRSAEDARDLTQAFFTRVIEKDYFQHADRTRGRFRTFLLTSVRHFLANEHDAATALKRGAGAHHMSLDTKDEERHVQEPVSAGETPDDLYERRWALAVIDAAMRRLESQYEAGPRATLFARLRPFLTGDESSSYTDLSGELSMSEGALRVALHRLRKQFGAALRGVVAETVDQPAEVDDELRYLLAVVSR